MDEEIECNNTWVWFDLSKGSRPIDKNSNNDKSTTKTKENLMSNKSAKEKNKFTIENEELERTENKLAIVKVKYKLVTNKVKAKSSTKKANNPTILEPSKI